MKNFEITLKSGEVVELDMSIFAIDNDKQMVNLTKIAKACGKLVGHWTSLDSTKEAVDVWSEEKGDIGKTISVIKGGDLDGIEQGTWVCKELAIDFAMWISPRFKVWCIKALDELFQKGMVSLVPQSYAQALLEAGRIALELEKKEQLLLEQKPKVEFAETVVADAESIQIGDYAKSLSKLYCVNVGPNHLRDYLRKAKYLMTGRGLLAPEKNKPYERYIECGWFELKYEPIKFGGVVPVTYITGKGQLALAKEIIEVFKTHR